MLTRRAISRRRDWAGGVVLALLPCIAWIPAGCQSSSALPAGSAEIRLTQGDGSASVGMTGILHVELVGNEGTGYGWKLAASDPAKLEQVGQPSITPLDPGILGGRTITTFEFRPLVPGTSQLVFEYVRPWLTNEPPGRRVTVEVNAKGGGS